MKNEMNTCNNETCCNGTAGQRPYDKEDVTTWSSLEFETKAADKIRKFWNKIESIKFLLKDGKIWIAGEQLQGVGDSISVLVKLFEDRIHSLENQERKD